MARPTDAELVKLLRDASLFYAHIDNKQVFDPSSAAAMQIVLDGARFELAAAALEAAPVPTVTFEERVDAANIAYGLAYTDSVALQLLSERDREIRAMGEALRAAGLSEEGCR